MKAGIYVQRSRKDQTSFANSSGDISFGDSSDNPVDTGFGFANMALGVYTSKSFSLFETGEKFFRTMTEEFESMRAPFRWRQLVAMARYAILREIESEHDQAAQELRQRITQLGGLPSDSSGAWGAWAQTVQGTMNLFGDTSALKSLKEMVQ